jgi:hypothetical protein
MLDLRLSKTAFTIALAACLEAANHVLDQFRTTIHSYAPRCGP